jgi:hypothetical protein
VAKEFEKDGMRVVQPQVTNWKLKERERVLFAKADTIPNWKLADKARRLLADMSHHLSPEVPSMVGRTLTDIEPTAARQFALIAVSGIVVRSVGAGMNLTACGYLPEAAGPARRGLEARLHGQAVLDDPSGQYAVRYLQGRGRRMTKLAQQYGAIQDIEILSQLTHADARGLQLLYTGPPEGDGDFVEGEFSVLPFRDEAKAPLILYILAYEAGSICAGLADAFGLTVQMPPWVSGELIRMRDELKAAVATPPRASASRGEDRPRRSPGSPKARQGRRRAGRRRR